MEKVDFAERVRLDVVVSVNLYTHLAEAQELWGAIQNIVHKYGAGCVWNLAKVSEYEWDLYMEWEDAPLEVFGKRVREYVEAKENWGLEDNFKFLKAWEGVPRECMEEDFIEVMKVYAPYEPKIEGGKSFEVYCQSFYENVLD